MPRIARLPEDLANQIAAGEVVERPASVVKELIENALDAGARRIAVAIELGGKRLIRVEDDGTGMDPEDARLSIERHATSKLRRAEDLAAIHTLGFRGEALPSIASVSRFRLRTCTRGAYAGSELRVDGGGVVSAAETGGPPGTLVEVTDLFYNVPARRKFLKSDAAEAAQVSRVVTQFALGYPEVGFTLTSGSRMLLQVPPVQGIRDRLYQIYGERPDLVEASRLAGGLRLFGFVAALAEQGPTRGPQHVFVNRRIVRDRTIAHAVQEAYSASSIRERSPEVHLFLELPADRVDVNVHPTKSEVRFRDQALVHEVVRRAVGDALGRGPAPALALRPPVAEAPVVVPQAIPGVLGGSAAPAPTPAGGHARESPAAASGAPGAWAGPPAPPGFRPLVPLGQFRDTFIIAADDEGLVIVDQHVAHERVLFERIMERLTAGPLERQRLIVPLVLPLSAAGCATLEERAAELERLGFEVEAFGGASVRVSAVPALLPLGAAEAAVRALGEDPDGLDRLGIEEAFRRMAATMACHAAVRAGDRLTSEKMQHILDELHATAYSTICPHGRPVMLRITRREIERNFERT